MTAPTIIGITGGSGSGKSSFLNKLRASFTEDELCVVSLDDYYIPREQQSLDDHGVTNFDLPSAVDLESFYQDILKLKRGEVVHREEYTFNNSLRTPKQLTFRPAPIIAIEGLYIFTDERVRAITDYKIFVHALSEFKLIRRIKRDEKYRNYPLKDVLYRYEKHVLPSFQSDIVRFREESDIVVNNNESYDKGLEVVVGFIRSKLV